MKDMDLSDAERYLQELSERVKRLRARRGMTRKDLSRHSGISERYLAQLEYGKANPSLVLLFRIVHAMGISLQQLLYDEEPQSPDHQALLEFIQRLTPEEQSRALSVLMSHFSGQQNGYSGIALIGLRGGGKTTLGRRLAETFDVPFVRLREIIEKLAGIEVGELFSLGGQKAYRRLERRAVDYAREHYPGGVIEATGGIVAELDTFKALRSAFYTVWVRADPEDHMNRVIRQGDLRPMEGNESAMDDLRRILAEREPFYRSANHAIHTSGRTVEACVAELATVCAPYLRAPPGEATAG
ncbi:MAG: helix-turn-helix transcriptional regulator [Ectothiorhodospiraceae bacterium]|nr:helix-turn-helix transcriptional regulator [Ectothiorhodospiraceae bacterium]